LPAANHALASVVVDADKVFAEPSPVLMMKSIKNEVEMNGFFNSHVSSS
jgi:hypothetical protein